MCLHEERAESFSAMKMCKNSVQRHGFLTSVLKHPISTLLEEVKETWKSTKISKVQVIFVWEASEGRYMGFKQTE